MEPNYDRVEYARVRNYQTPNNSRWIVGRPLQIRLGQTKSHESCHLV